MAPHSSTLAWKILWMEEPGRLQSMGSLRVGHNWATSLWLFTFMHRRRKWQPTPVFLPGGSQGRGAWWATVYGVAKSRTRLKWLSSSSSLGTCWYPPLPGTADTHFWMRPPWLTGVMFGQKYWPKDGILIIMLRTGLGFRLRQTWNFISVLTKHWISVRANTCIVYTMFKRPGRGVPILPMMKLRHRKY